MAFAKLEPKTELQKRWKVLRKLAEGGFGAVYEAYDKKTETKVALKLEAPNQINPVLKMETGILLKLRGRTEHVCGILGQGYVPNKYIFIVMNLIGNSLADVHKDRPKRKFTESTTLRLALQCLQGIEELHKIGFLHRDIKPGNYAIGRGGSRRIVYLLDFGLARCYLNADNEVRPPRKSCGFRGTVRYASNNAHFGLELGRHDDIWSLFYMLIEFQRGTLPWHDAESDAAVARTKRKIEADVLLEGMEDEFKEIYEQLQGLRYDDRPKYDWFRQKFRDIQKRKELVTRGKFEWEEKEKEEKEEKVDE